MKKATLILLLSFSFLVFGSQTTNARDEAEEIARLADYQLLEFKSKPSLNGLEVIHYKRVELFVRLENEKSSFKLTEERIRTKCELRLRQAGLEPVKSRVGGEYFSVSIKIFPSTYGMTVSFLRPVLFYGGTTYSKVAITWQKVIFGTHGDDENYIVNGLDEKIDSFLNEYLKANAK